MHQRHVISLLIHGFLSVNARLLVAFGTAFYAIIWITVGQGPTALAVGAGGGYLNIFNSHLSFLFSFSLSLGDGPI